MFDSAFHRSNKVGSPFDLRCVKCIVETANNVKSDQTAPSRRRLIWVYLDLGLSYFIRLSLNTKCDYCKFITLRVGTFFVPMR